MPIGSFLNPSQPPGLPELEEALGAAYPLWERLLRFIQTNYQISPEMNFGGKKYGWNLTYRKSGRSLVSLFPQQAAFVVKLVLGRAQVEKPDPLPLSEKLKRLLQETPTRHDGKWLFIPVTDEADVMDVERLLLLKRRPVLPLDKKP
jgi:hypothetical protein